MRYIKRLSQETRKILERIYRESKYYQVRKRAHCIRLSAEGYEIVELMKIFRVSRNTIYNWFNNWEKFSLAGLYNQKGRGRKALFNQQEQETIKQWAKESPKNLEKVREKIEKQWGIKVSKDTIKRILKIVKMGWYRFKRTVGGSPNPEFYQAKKQELEDLKEKDRKGEIDLRYVDESGFCLTPYIPYGWQEKSERIAIKSQKSQRINVIGFLNQGGQLEAYTFEKSITSDVFIACLDKFSEKISLKTVLVMDNSSIHQNNLLWEKEKEWSDKGLSIFFLPSYSPQLNKIEILWRLMKYQWLEPENYESYLTLVEAVENILKYFGEKYTINFT
ncbi:IS630 family transposase [Aphanothece hegewaldii CCALA 016]|uniref:IS630 family transposase n=2 Tax=Aphanothece TaxID=1121 RepID=A0A2T1LQ92_9CHRO|nr:IS630 family transposase [Aphanothece hegewaldii CCALA 016]